MFLGVKTHQLGMSKMVADVLGVPAQVVTRVSPRPHFLPTSFLPPPACSPSSPRPTALYQAFLLQPGAQVQCCLRLPRPLSPSLYNGG